MITVGIGPGKDSKGVLVVPDPERWHSRSNPHAGIAHRLRETRLALELSQEKAAEKAGLSPGFIALVEQGRRGVSRKTLHRMARAYGVEPYWLETGEQPGVEGEAPALSEIVALARTVPESDLPDLRDMVRLWVQQRRREDQQAG
ncbi:MAG: helix-turn-helix transcriptional regulator [Chloroflexota bacterium]|nr:helix-turn-helix transcriptional regulator [Chloroflexota bacterium]